LEAPKGRLILPQVRAILDCLDNDASVMVVKERELASALDNLKRPPDLVVCDSQVVLKAASDTPLSIPLTTFSILFSRAKGDLTSMARGAAMIHRLKAGDKVILRRESPRILRITFKRAGDHQGVLKLSATWKVIDAEF